MTGFALSKREREVVRLAAQGLTDEGIARHLSLSVRTIQNHLHAVYKALELPEGNPRILASRMVWEGLI